jgi:hypothetical protein
MPFFGGQPPAIALGTAAGTIVEETRLLYFTLNQQ